MDVGDPMGAATTPASPPRRERRRYSLLSMFAAVGMFLLVLGLLVGDLRIVLQGVFFITLATILWVVDRRRTERQRRNPGDST